MRRLPFLLACLLVVSGCSGIGDQSTTSRLAPSVTVTAAEFDRPNINWPFGDPGRWPDTTRPHVVGDPSTAQFDGTIVLYAWNASPENRTLTVTLAYDRDNRTLYREAVTLDSNEALGFELGQSGRYALSVALANRTETMTLTPAALDCNDQAHVIWVERNGTLTKGWASQSMACPTTRD